MRLTRSAIASVLAQSQSVFVAALLLLTAVAASAEWLPGRVVSIADGDTLTVLTPEKRQVRVRLTGIDAPESGQPYGNRSKQALSELVFGREVSVRTSGTDRYGRTLGIVFVGETDVNREMLRRGAAWVYRKYEDSESMLAVEERARTERRGLWDLPEYDRVAPWDWRSGAGQHHPPSKSETADFTCGSKRYCRDMATCEEARFYLTECGLSRLDGDKDGTPCENLCR